jgi:hypothetical protein
MTTNKTPRSLLGLALGGMTVLSLLALGLLAVLLLELIAPGLSQAGAAYRAAWQESTGNEFTGEATALLFGASTIPVGIDLISKTVTRYAPIGEAAKGLIRRVNLVQRKTLMPLHTWLSILALSLGILHLTLSSCIANPLPELGLILSGGLVASGLLFKCKAVPASIRKTLYQFHASLIVSGILLAILFSGHAVMSSD